MDYSAIWISLKTAGASIVITFFLGVWVAWAVCCMRGHKVKMILDGILTLPLVLPPTVAGFFLLYIFGVQRPFGRFLLEVLGVKLVFSWPATVVAAVVISFPLMYRSARGAFEQIDINILQAAQTIGMPRRRIFWRVAMPTALPGVAGGAVLAFARSLGEFGATTMIAGNIAGKTRTLPLAVASAVAGGNMQDAYGYVSILVGISLLVVFGMNWAAAKGRLAGRKGGKL